MRLRDTQLYHLLICTAPRLLSRFRSAWRSPAHSAAFAAAAKRYGEAYHGNGFANHDRRRGYVALVTREDLFPTNHGAAVKIERTAWGLSHFRDGVLLITGDWARYYLFKNGHAEERFFPRAVRLSGFLALLVRRSLPKSEIPANETYLYHAATDWSYSVRLWYLTSRYLVTAYQAEFPAYATPCLRVAKLRPAQTILVEHNVECDRIRAQYPGMPVRAYEWLRRFELDLCKRVDHVVAVSKLDRDSLVEYGVGSDKLTVIPHGVDYFAFQRDYGIGLREAYGVPVEFPILVYHGIYSYAPNLEAVELVATEILPRLADRGVLVEFFAIGPEPPTANLNPHVRFTGAVENVVPYLKSANLAIVPLQQGGGTRMKVLEYFAAGVPVVATAKALDGIPVKDGVHVLVEDSFEGMADAICRLLEDPIKQARLAKRAKQFVSELDWLHIASCYSALLR